MCMYVYRSMRACMCATATKQNNNNRISSNREENGIEIDRHGGRRTNSSHRAAASLFSILPSLVHFQSPFSLSCVCVCLYSEHRRRASASSFTFVPLRLLLHSIISIRWSFATTFASPSASVELTAPSIMTWTPTNGQCSYPLALNCRYVLDDIVCHHNNSRLTKTFFGLPRRCHHCRKLIVFSAAFSCQFCR